MSDGRLVQAMAEAINDAALWRLPERHTIERLVRAGFKAADVQALYDAAARRAVIIRKPDPRSAR